jgi:hypothetical protein
MDIWLLVYPVSAPAYWPQPGPLRPVNSQFYASATIGQSATTNKGEKFILIIVEAPPAVSQRFQYFDSHPEGTGLPKLPDGTTPLTQIAVIRS